MGNSEKSMHLLFRERKTSQIHRRYNRRKTGLYFLATSLRVVPRELPSMGLGLQLRTSRLRAVHSTARPAQRRAVSAHDAGLAGPPETME